MTIGEVLHALVDRLPKDWDLSEHHRAVDEHFGPPPAAAAAEPEPEPPSA